MAEDARAKQALVEGASGGGGEAEADSGGVGEVSSDVTGEVDGDT